MADTVLKTRVIESTCSHLLSSRQRLAADLVVSHISKVMPAQERLLRDLVACRACPRLTKAVTAVAGDQDPASLPYEQLLHLLQSLPITDYSGDLEASYRALLDAMRAGIDTELIQTLAAGLCDEVPSDWDVTSGTTGSSKVFPMTAANLDRTLRATGKHTSEVQLLKFPLRPHKPSSSSSSAQEDEQQYEWRHRTLSLALAGPCEELPGSQLVGSISSVYMNKLSKLGIVVDRDLQGRDMSTRPAKLMYAMAKPGVEAAPRHYALWLCAAAEPGLERVTFLTDLFAGNMLTAIGVMQRHWRDMVQDLITGKMSSSLAQGLPDAAAALVNAHLASLPAAARTANAAHIQQVMTAHAATEAAGEGQPLLGQLMPNLHAVLVVVTGSHSKFWPSLRPLIAQDVAVCTPWHAGTEGIYGVSLQLIQPGPYDTSLHPVDQQFVVMATGNCFFEFLPVGRHDSSHSSSNSGHDSSSNSGCTGGCGCPNGEASQVAKEAAGGLGQPVAAAAAICEPPQVQQQQQQQRALTMDELQVGHDYEVLVSTFVGLTRYRVGDVLRVDGFVNFDTNECLTAQHGCDPAAVLRLPMVSFKGRVGVVLNLVWEKYDEGQLLQAVRYTVQDLQQQQQQQQAFPGLAEFTVYEDHSDEASKRYSFFWELLPTSMSAAAATAAAAAAPPLDAAAAADTYLDSNPSLAAAATVSEQAVADWEGVLNQNLGKHNAVYAGMLAAGQVASARVQLVAPGSFKALQDAQVAAKHISPSQFKMPTVVAPDSEYVRFLKQRIVVLSG